MRLNKFVIALLILTPVIGGYFWIEKAAHDGIAARKATERYLAANPPPKPIEIKIEGCPPGSWNTKLYGHVFVLDTNIEVPCSLSNGKYYLVGREFYLQWQEVVSTPTKNELYFHTIYQGTVIPAVESDVRTPRARVKAIPGTVEVSLPGNTWAAETADFVCQPHSCRGWVLVSPNVQALINVYEERGIDKAELTVVLTRVFSRVKQTRN